MSFDHQHQPRERFEGGDSLEEAREWMDGARAYAPGAVCPVCDQNAGYTQQLTKGSVRELIRFATRVNDLLNRDAAKGERDRKFTTYGLKTSEVLGAGATSYSQDQLAVNAHFGLIEHSGNRRGWWRMTALGRDFLYNGAKVPKVAWMFMGEVMAYMTEEGEITADDVMTVEQRAKVEAAEKTVIEREKKRRKE